MQLGFPKTPFRQQDYPIVMAQRQYVVQYTVCDRGDRARGNNGYFVLYSYFTTSTRNKIEC